jgi:hypothetical protein
LVNGEIVVLVVVAVVVVGIVPAGMYEGLFGCLWDLYLYIIFKNRMEDGKANSMPFRTD